MNPNTVIIGRN